jgi:hypothetical protein
MIGFDTDVVVRYLIIVGETRSSIIIATGRYFELLRCAFA